MPLTGRPPTACACGRTCPRNDGSASGGTRPTTDSGWLLRDEQSGRRSVRRRGAFQWGRRAERGRDVREGRSCDRERTRDEGGSDDQERRDTRRTAAAEFLRRARRRSGMMVVFVSGWL